MPQQYPLSAVVPSRAGDRDDMTLALVLTTISPEVGGVLVRGEKGTAKSTTVRALASVLPPIEVVAGDRFSSRPGDTSPDGPGPDGLRYCINSASLDFAAGDDAGEEPGR